MLKRARTLIGRMRRATADPGTPRPAARRRWENELADAGITADAWLAGRVAESRSYVDLPDARVAELANRYPLQTRATLEAAERILRHEFDLLGSGSYVPIDPERARFESYRPIDWYLDPVANLRFPTGVPIASWDLYAMRPGTADVKFPWELARCQHWPLLGQAYKLTGDACFALEIGRQLEDFVQANPLGTAVNWACTMDVALRAANWAVALDLVRRCPELTSTFWRAAYEALFDHGVFIETHLENTFEVTSNHYLSDIVGLFFLAPVFRDLPKGRAWASACREWITHEIDVQVLSDGADFESSVPYHRLVAELFLGAMRVADFLGTPFAEPNARRVQGMIDFLAAVVRPDGLMPQIGDADDGRLHVLSGYGVKSPQDGRHLFGPASCLFSTGSWAHLVDEWSRWEAAWWGFDEPPTMPRPARHETVRHFPEAGLTVFRHGRDCLFVTNGRVGTNGFGNHKHNDLLAFEYHVCGQPVFVDPGSYVYTSDFDARNLFRSTRSHNTLSIDDEEQNVLRPDWLFRLFETAAPEHLAVVESDDRLEYRGRHHGYERLGTPVTHERTFTLSRLTSGLTILDVLAGQGAHHVRWHFHVAPGLDVHRPAPGAFQITLPEAVVTLHTPDGIDGTLSPAWYSPSYGVRVPCFAVDCRHDLRLDGRSEFVFRVVVEPC